MVSRSRDAGGGPSILRGRGQPPGRRPPRSARSRSRSRSLPRVGIGSANSVAVGRRGRRGEARAGRRRSAVEGWEAGSHRHAARAGASRRDPRSRAKPGEAYIWTTQPERSPRVTQIAPGRSRQPVVPWVGLPSGAQGGIAAETDPLVGLLGYHRVGRRDRRLRLRAEIDQQAVATDRRHRARPRQDLEVILLAAGTLSVVEIVAPAGDVEETVETWLNNEL